MRSLALLVLCLLVWGPTVGYAQSEQAPRSPSDAPTRPPLVTAPEGSEEPPPGEIIPRAPGSAEAPADLRIPRLVLSPILGTATTAGGGVLGIIFSGLFLGCSITDGDSCSDWAAYTPLLVGGWAAGSFTVYGIGSLLNGEGTLAPTLLGGAMGVAGGIGLLFVTQGAAVYALPLMPALGAAIGFELSDRYERSLQSERDEFAGVQWMPVLSTTREGGLVGGLVGRF